MDTRDSGLIDLFAIHKEEEARVSAHPAPLSGPPPAVSFDTTPRMGEDLDIDGFAAAQAKSRTRAKIIGGAIGGLAVVGIIIAAAFAGGGTLAAKDVTATASQLPPTAVTVPAPAASPAPVATPAPTEAAKDDAKPAGYTRAQAIAAYKGAQGKAKRHFSARASGPKLQKIQSSGTN